MNIPKLNECHGVLPSGECCCKPATHLFRPTGDRYLTIPLCQEHADQTHPDAGTITPVST